RLISWGKVAQRGFAANCGAGSLCCLPGDPVCGRQQSSRNADSKTVCPTVASNNHRGLQRLNDFVVEALSQRLRLTLLLALSASTLLGVDSRICGGCHQDIYRKYMTTPMARSSGPVDRLTDAAF